MRALDRSFFLTVARDKGGRKRRGGDTHFVLNRDFSQVLLFFARADRTMVIFIFVFQEVGGLAWLFVQLEMVSGSCLVFSFAPGV